ncbi:Cof-type HAD-IIB family hydrolase [Bacillus mangrovi]|uniref:Cof-type HAD-IIB family hydrolase n=1 Tax=Metabacillus mangrovi TaxID=1491830 RepID=A0A7X2S3M4_9BACI|nr:Cof-type HAD-IIB family hydrolase [Metabacillus mangrovi]MTH53029.1 Cof-type HAD-IIB family hydrolase [Metabacillus mangrovi]
MTKIAAIDLDGTLLNSKNEISPENLHAMKAAAKRGIEVIIATGRAHFDVQAIFKNTGINPWIIAANGATIHDPDGLLFHSVPIRRDEAIEVMKWLETREFYYEVFSSEAIYTPQKGRELLQIEMDRLASSNPEISQDGLKLAAYKQFSQTGFQFIDSCSSIPADAELYNILAFSFNEEKRLTGWEQFKDHPGLTIVTSANHNFELEHEDDSKGIALKKLAEKFGVSLEETAAIGDSMNDESMIQAAGKKFAMGNAREEIKIQSDAIMGSNDEHGVAQMLNRL